MPDKQKLFAVYQEIGNGRPYVMIHDMRNHLKWDRIRFDSVLISLAKSGDIELTGGDPSQMTDDQINDSFTDALGYQLFSICWRKL